MLIIKNVLNNGVASELGLKRNDIITHFDGFEACDVLDLQFYDAQESFVMTIKRGEEVIDFEIEKDFDETLGIELESDNLQIKTCRNKCIFCFIDQMPKGQRDTLYVKDDDYRQSFLFGNYVTLTNVSDSELERIIRLHLSPIYVSVHATDESVRCKMLNNRFSGNILNQLKKLSDGGIEIHTQIVLVKGVNDGEVLDRTVSDLSSIDLVESIAVVPCGITAHRNGLFPIEDIDQSYSTEIIARVRGYNKRLNKNLVLCADEFYVRAGLETEDISFYGDFSQLGNGVGVFRAFEDEFNSVCEKTSYKRTILIVTGVSAYDFIKKYAEITEQMVSGLKVHVAKAKNGFFGECVTCTGLITAGDVIRTVNEFNEPFDELVISSVMLKDGESLFIDGVSVSELSSSIKKPVKVSFDSGEGFFNTLSGKC